jgi:hypothetical protein
MNHKAKMLPPAAKQNRILKLFFWLAGIAVILIAFFFRFYRLADHPLGIFFDPAINGLDVARLVQRGGPVIFFPTNGGREALFMYLLMIPIWLFGAIPFSMRALTATFGLLTVVCLFAWLAHLRQWPEKAGDGVKASAGPLPKGSASQADLLGRSHDQLWFATLAGLTLATSYWHIAVSRLGQRPIMVAMLSVPLFWFFLKGWATGQKRWFVLAGLVMGLEGHTYSAARLLPVILVLTLLPEFIPGFRRSQLNYRQTFSNLLIFFMVAAIIYLPMAWYLLTHPAQFTERASSVMVWNFLDTPATILAEFGRNLVRVAGFFCCAGSLNPIFGWPNYPGSSPFLLPFLLFGLLIALKNWRNLFQRLVIIWWLVGLLPSIAAIEAPHPWRMINGVVPTAILIALGLLHASIWLQTLIYPYLSAAQPRPSRFTFYVLRFTPYTLPLLLVLLPLPGLFRAYFLDWTQLKVTQGIYDYGAVAIRDAILDQADQDIPIYLPLSRFGDSTLLYYLSGHFQRQAVLSVPASESVLLISPEKNMADSTWVRLHRGLATILPPLTQTGQQQVQQALNSPSAKLIRTATGEIAARQQLLAGDLIPFIETPLYPLEASFGPARLVGATYSKTIDPQAPLPVTLFWQANQAMSSEYEVLLRLVDDRRQAWGNGDGRPTGWAYPTSFWRAGLDTVAAQQSIVIASPQLEPGRYWLAVSIFDSSTGRRLPLTAGPPDSPDTLYLGPLKVPLPGPDHLPDFSPRPVVTFGETIRLDGFNLDQRQLTAGETIRLTLLWQALTSPTVDYTVFVHLLDKEGNLITGNDRQPVNHRYPTTIWSAGEKILDLHTVATPADLPPGQYRLAIGLYQAATGERLPLIYPDGAKDSQGRFILEPVITITTGS